MQEEFGNLAEVLTDLRDGLMEFRQVITGGRQGGGRGIDMFDQYCVLVVHRGRETETKDKDLTSCLVEVLRRNHLFAFFFRSLADGH